MSVRIIVPHRGLAAAKTRLAGVLDPEHREALAHRLLDHVLDVVRAVPDADAEVISPDPELSPIVEGHGIRLVVQRGMGLNAGLDQARDQALTDGIATLLVLHGDLPELTVEDVQALLTALPHPRGVAIAPDAAGTGTNALALLPPDVIGFAFGTGSFAAHTTAAHNAGCEPVVVRREGLAFDLDTPDDLARWLAREGTAA